MFIISTAAPVLTQPTISVTNVTTVSAQVNLLTPATGAAQLTYFLTVIANPGAPLPSSVTYFVAVFPYTVTALIPGTPYAFTLEARDIIQNIYRSQASALQQITTGSTATAPGQVTGLTAIPVSSSQINLTWNVDSGASTYTLVRNGTVVFSGLLATTFSDTSLPASTLETYQVAGVNSTGIGAYSTAASATTQTAIGPPPVGFGIKMVGNKLINTANGAQVILQGGNISGLESSNPIANSYNIIAGITPAQWRTIMTTWGINCFRFPLNSAYIINHTVYDDPSSPGYAGRSYTSIGGGAYTPDPAGGYMAAVTQIAQNLGAGGGFAVFDLHWDAPKSSLGRPIAPIGQPGFPSDYAAQAHTILANAVKAMPWVIIEQFNEPFGDNVFGDCVNTGTNPFSPGPFAVKQLAGGTMTNFVTQKNPSNAIVGLNGGAACTVATPQQMLNATRATGATNVVLGAPIWYAGQIEVWEASYKTASYGGPVTDPQGQFAAAWHDYGYSYGTGGALSVLAGGNPIVMTETAGFDSALDGGKSANGYTWAASQGIGVILWSWATWASGGATTAAAMFNYLNTTSPWTDIVGATGKPAPTGNKFTQGPYVQAASGVPAPAAAVGYNTKTFDSTTWGATTGPLYTASFFGNTEAAGSIVQNSDGSLTLGQNVSNNVGVCSAIQDNSQPHKWRGLAFGGGGYFEATFSLAGTPNGTQPTAAWAINDIENLSTGYDPLNNWIEVDDIESNVASLTHYGQAIHNWYGTRGSGAQVQPNVGSPVTLPSGANLNQSNKFGFLWVTATASTQGYAKFFVNDVQTGTTLSWNQYNAGQPNPPTISPPTAGNIMDVRHMTFTMGGITLTPMHLTSVKVWQVSGAGNITS
jgi:hypothetical protein